MNLGWKNFPAEGTSHSVKCETSESEAHEIDSTSSFLLKARAELLKLFQVLDSLSVHLHMQVFEDIVLCLLRKRPC